MECAVEGHTLTIKKTKGDRFKRGGYGGTAETQLFTHVRRMLQALGFEAIHKRMAKDGHMVDDHQTYVRFRVPGSKEWTAVTNGSWALYDAGERLMADGSVDLMLVNLGGMA